MAVLRIFLPVLRLYLDKEVDLKPDYRLNRAFLEHLIGITCSQQDHEWGHYLEVPVFVFWLASATSYRVVSQSFNIPCTTVHDMVHKVSRKLLKITNQIICFPSLAKQEDVGNRFTCLAGSPAFSKVVGCIDSCQICVKPPSVDAQCYMNWKLFPSIQLHAVCDSTLGEYIYIFTS